MVDLMVTDDMSCYKQKKWLVQFLLFLVLFFSIIYFMNVSTKQYVSYHIITVFCVLRFKHHTFPFPFFFF